MTQADLFPTAPAAPRYDLALVACSATKARTATPIPAAELYTSALFSKARALAERDAGAWCILSAFHGALPPDRLVVPYERTLLEMRQRERDAWGARTASALLAAFPDARRVLVLAGRTYRDAVAWHLERAGRELVCPLAGMGIGEQLGWLTRTLRAEVPA